MGDLHALDHDAWRIEDVIHIGHVHVRQLLMRRHLRAGAGTITPGLYCYGLTGVSLAREPSSL